MFEDKPKRLATKEQACLAQIEASIRHLWAGDFECAITLAGAAEGQLNYHGPEVLRERVLSKVHENDRKPLSDVLNAHRDWLKHTTPDLGDEVEISEFEAVFMVVRAITKFNGKFDRTTPLIARFAIWCRAEGYFDPAPAEASAGFS